MSAPELLRKSRRFTLHPPRIAFDRAQHPRVGEAATEHAGHRVLDLLIRWSGVLVDERLRRENDAVQAVAALRGLLVDECLLYRVRLFGRAETFERRDFRAADRSNWCDARADRAAVDDRRARPALTKAATELR